MQNKLEEARDFLAGRIGQPPRIAMITGTGLGGLTDRLELACRIDYGDIPHFPVSTTEGHRGTLAVGQMAGKCVMALEGRFHLYEGYSPEEIVFPVRVARMMGATHLFVSSAAGGLNPRFSPGDLMIVLDHINMTGRYPLTGTNPAFLGPRFPDMSRAYDPDLVRLAVEASLHEGLDVQRGVYVAVHGPHLETPAETRFLRLIGGDAVGMSTALETVAAVHCGLKVLAIVVLTNVNHPDRMEEISLEEVIFQANRASPKLARLWHRITERLEPASAENERKTRRIGFDGV